MVDGTNGINNNSFLDVLLTLKQNIMRDLNVAEVCKIVEVQSGSVCVVNPINNRNQRLYVYNLYNATVSVDDLVLVVFTNTDSRLNLNKAANDISLQDTQEKILHSINYGIIVGKSSGSGGQSILYDTIGQNTDGAMTQKASTDNFALKTSIPTQASDVHALPDTTKYASSISLTISGNSITVQLKDQNGNNIGTSQTISVTVPNSFVNASYNNSTKKITFTYADSNTLDVDISPIISGLQTEITSTNKLPSDLVDDTNQTNKFATEQQLNQIATNTNDISDINDKIPSDASSSNKLVSTNTMNSSVATNTATFRGNYNLVTDLGLTISATESQIITALANTISVADNNDYCYVRVPTSDSTPTQIDHVDRYKYNGTSWTYEYTLNNSGFTAAQWAAINSGANSTNIAQITTNANNISSLQSNKQDKIDSTHKLNADLVEDGTTNKVFTATEQTKLSGIEDGAEVNVQPDWNQSDSTADDYIKNKPTIPSVSNATIIITQGGSEKGRFTLNQSNSQTIPLDAGGGGSSIDVQVDSASIVAQNIANIITTGVYNSSTNPFALKDYVDNGLAGKANNNEVVHITAAETIKGTKTFQSDIIFDYTSNGYHLKAKEGTGSSAINLIGLESSYGVLVGNLYRTLSMRGFSDRPKYYANNSGGTAKDLALFEDLNWHMLSQSESPKIVTTGASGTVTIDLSNYIPNFDASLNYVYEVLILNETYNSDTRYIYSRTDVMDNPPNGSGISDMRFSSNGRQGGWIRVMPAKRYLYFQKSGSINNFDLRVAGYRRCQ